MTEDTWFMRRALELAARGLGRTSPNPAVGAVVVQAGEIVGEGWHRAAGQPHAEVEALRAAGPRVQGATVYVSLEPCSHYGRTPPCTQALIDAEVARVVWAGPDVDPRSAGRAAELLQAAGIVAEEGLLREEARRLNEAYFKHKATGLPFVTLKLALTLDGRAATRSGDSRWITGEEARRQVHQMRDQSDAVMVGAGTACADDPELTVRMVEPADGRQPVRVVLGARGLAGARRMLALPGRTLALVAEGTELSPPPAGGEIEIIPVPAPQGALDLGAALRELGRRDLMSVLLEGGPTLAGSFLAQGLVDKLVLFYAPKLLLDEQALGPWAPGRSVEKMAEALEFAPAAVEQVGPDLKVTLYPCSRD